MIALVVYIASGLLPIVWLVSEWSPRRSLRVVAGVLALVAVFFGAIVLTESIPDKRAAYFDGATTDLVTVTANRLRSGDTDAVLGEYESLQRHLAVRQESLLDRGEFIQLAANRLRSTSATSAP